MRDYCQHGEPMDEHCPQCAGHTKAAANISATAPVPAGGTPEGLAREKVEMTDSEVKPNSPTTEAERLHERLCRIYEEARTIKDMRELQELAGAIAAIEQQAREGGYSSGLLEGRREAVREIRAGVMAMQPEPLEEWRPAVLTILADVPRLRTAIMEGTDSDTGDVWLHRQDADILRGLVAGLEAEGRSPIGSNASESPPPEYRPHQLVRDLNPSWDASESPPTDAIAGIRARHSFHDGRLQQADLCPSEDHRADLHALFGIVGIGDASESGHTHDPVRGG